MEILGIGAPELMLIVVLALIVLGPRDMQKAGRTLGRWLRQLVTSDGWKFFQQTSREIQTLPNRLMRDAALEELQQMEQSIRKPFQGMDPRLSGKDLESDGETGGSAAPGPEPQILPSPPAVPPRSDSDKNA
jgi:sec-independent protein translocase protein TatB